MNNVEVGFRITEDRSTGATFQRIINDALVHSLLPRVQEMAEDATEITEIVKTLTAELSRETSDIRSLVKGLIVLSEMPKSKAVASKHLHLDENRIKTLGKQFWHLVGQDKLMLADNHLVKHLTPQAQDEETILPRTLGARCKEILGTIGAQKKTPEKKERETQASISHVGEHVEVRLVLDLVTGKQLEEQLQKVREQLECDLLEAFTVCLKLDKAPEVILHAVASMDGGVYLDNGVQLSMEDFANVDLVKTALLNPYREVDSGEVPFDMATLVRGRDGSCRAPYCEKPAHDCEVRHVIPHAEHGKTNPANLHTLCDKHYRLVAEGEMSVVQQPNGLNLWTLEDGSMINTLPQGVLATQIVSGDVAAA